MAISRPFAGCRDGRPGHGGGAGVAGERRRWPGPRRSTTNQGGNQPPVPGQRLVEPQAESVPSGCPTAPPDSSGYTDEPWYRWSWTDDQNINELCSDAVRLAPTWVAQKAIKYAFSKLGTPYSQDTVLRTTTRFDCSGFVGRAFTAAGAYMYQNGVYQNRTFFNMFGWTGAYTKYPPYSGFPAPGYHDSTSSGSRRKGLAAPATSSSSSTALGPGLLGGQRRPCPDLPGRRQDHRVQ